tara:strand:- start:412 stop:681 length:270 start_codon:yes stop_codon:yes gene_type:complete
MALVEKRIVDKVEFVGPFKVCQVREDIQIIDDSTDEIKSRGNWHRYVLKPGNDISGQSAEIQSLCNAAWTQEIKDAFIAQIKPPPGISE